MKIAITGASGLIGTALTSYLTAEGHEVVPLVRKQVAPGKGRIHWNPAAGVLETAQLEGINAVVHLAGENVVLGRWTAAKKKRIRDSRINGTRLLAATLAKLENPPEVLISASAIGYYGNRGEEILTEDSTQGANFLSQVCVEWEGATAAAQEKGIRTVFMRISMVLSKAGGALGKMLPPFKLGLGGRLSHGRQYNSWIAIDDLLRAVSFILTNKNITGPVNFGAPNPVTNIEFTKTLGRVLRRPTVFLVPAFAVRLLFGEVGDALFLASMRMLPRKLVDMNFEFSYPDLDGALRHILKR
ncbi:TIGR01777 family oxidoreductase [Planctomycetota bacterium]